MSYADLNAGLQIIVMYNYEVFLKTFLVFCIVGLSIFYLFKYKPFDEKPTPYYTVGIFRLLITIFSQWILITSPLLLLLLSPEIEGFYVYSMFTYPYLVIFVSLLAVALADFLYYGFAIIFKMGGMDIKDPNVAKVFNKIQKEGKLKG